MHVLSITLSLIWMLLFWRVTRYHSQRLPERLFQNLGKLFFGVAACFIAVLLSSPELWQSLYKGYPHDGFFGLELKGRLGVLLISTTCITLFFVALAAKTRWILHRTSANLSTRMISLIADCLLSLLLFGFLFSLTPQLYYTLYQFVFPNLPNQIVIKSAFDWKTLQTIAKLSLDDTLSHHLSGITLLAIIPFTTWLHGLHRNWQRESIVLTVVAVLSLQYASIF